MPLYWGDYLKNTCHLSTVEHGAYLLLIAHYWERGSLPTEDDRLRRITGLGTKQWRKCRPIIAAFFLPDWKHVRLEELLREDQLRRLKMSQLSQKRWKNNEGAMRPASPTDCVSESYSYSQRKKDAAIAANGSGMREESKGPSKQDLERDLFARGKQ